MLTEYRYGALSVVEHVADSDWINRRLREIDRRLFVEQQLNLAEERVWCVMLNIGDAGPPLHIFEWRDREGRPIPALTEGIVTEIQRMKARGPIDLNAIDESNRRLQQEKEQEAVEAFQEIADDFERMSRRSSVIPRSKRLAQTKARQRASRPRGQVDPEL